MKTSAAIYPLARIGYDTLSQRSEALGEIAMSPQPNPNHQDSAAALRSAISEGDVETVLNLLDRGADVNARIVIDDIWRQRNRSPAARRF